ncbi:DUF6386 family protein [Pseudomonas alliivorans]|nr:DUF6386 family protein [Pseudomonas alliivorans]MEE4876615.1 DUF6386 family protein [Pseudomonas alliivorans]MEE4999869.1 DUF6386 family protein [Pseudomonas alliivorans]
MSKEFSFFTDTATMAIFDLAAIKHRISDTSDWWSIEEDEIDEVNKGNIAFLDLGSDGSYVVKIQEEVDDEDGSLNLSFPTGQVFIGAGEDTTGGELEPDGSDAIQGEMLSFAPGNYSVKYKKIGDNIVLSFSVGSGRINFFKEVIRL